MIYRTVQKELLSFPHTKLYPFFLLISDSLPKAATFVSDMILLYLVIIATPIYNFPSAEINYNNPLSKYDPGPVFNMKI